MDSLSEIRYDIDKGLIKEYVLEIASYGFCKRLGKIRYTKNVDSYEICFDTSGLCKIKGSYKDILHSIRRITEAVIRADDYGLDQEYILLSKEYVFLDKDNEQAVILPGPRDERPFVERICELANSLAECDPEGNGDLVSEKIAKENAVHILNGEALLHLLSLWELELIP